MYVYEAPQYLNYPDDFSLFVVTEKYKSAKEFTPITYDFLKSLKPLEIETDFLLHMGLIPVKFDQQIILFAPDGQSDLDAITDFAKGISGIYYNEYRKFYEQMVRERRYSEIERTKAEFFNNDGKMDEIIGKLEFLQENLPTEIFDPNDNKIFSFFFLKKLDSLISIITRDSNSYITEYITPPYPGDKGYEWNYLEKHLQMTIKNPLQVSDVGKLNISESTQEKIETWNQYEQEEIEIPESFWEELVKEIKNVLNNPEKIAEIVVELALDSALGLLSIFFSRWLWLLLLFHSKELNKRRLEKHLLAIVSSDIDKVCSYYSVVPKSRIGEISSATGIPKGRLQKLLPAVQFEHEPTCFWKPPKLKLSFFQRIKIFAKTVIKYKRKYKKDSEKDK